ncbi:MAG: hypothetical protein Q7T73_07970, partial [Beijerinckiaceae bacterium]|nr:hypothetical protein [Beijerinckiaceae bacterium]
MATKKADSSGSGNALKLARRLKLKFTTANELTLSRKRLGERFTFQDAKGQTIRDRALLQRLKSLAMPPAYEDVRYAADEWAHLQATGRDGAGRTQYRYHPDWQKVRELRKASRLASMAEALPRIRRAIGRHLGETEPGRALALAAVTEGKASTCTSLEKLRWAPPIAEALTRYGTDYLDKLAQPYEKCSPFSAMLTSPGR